MTSFIIDTAIKKAMQSPCHFPISAVGLDKNGKVIGVARNSPRFSKYGGGVHAEIALLRKAGIRLKSIIICRVNKHGKILPIKPCKSCSRIFQKRGIKIMTVKPIVIV
jgi:tRNA(Arg) A34 adenosine deaminase TadA